MELTLNTAPATPADLEAFQAEYAEWNAAVEATIPPEEPAERGVFERDPLDLVREQDEADEQMDRMTGGQDVEQACEDWDHYSLMFDMPWDD